MFDLLETPKDFAQHVMRTTASMGSIVLYGHRAPNYENFWGSVSSSLSIEFIQALTWTRPYMKLYMR